jgi:hypothetical protein
MCAVHGKRFYKYGDAGTDGRMRQRRFAMPQPPRDGYLWCSLCESELPITEFDRSQNDGYRKVGRCKTCTSYAKAASRYNVSADELRAMEARQDNRCAICRCVETKPWRMSLDHDHSCCPSKSSCGECVRELLCDSCNRMIGPAHDDVSLLLSAVAYLELWSTRRQNRTDDTSTTAGPGLEV